MAKKAKSRTEVVGYIEYNVPVEEFLHDLGVKTSTVVTEILAWTDGSIDGKYIVLKETSLKPEYRTAQNRVLKADGGFGCRKDTMGSAVYTIDCHGRKERWERSDVMGIMHDAFGSEFFRSMEPNTEDAAVLGEN